MRCRAASSPPRPGRAAAGRRADAKELQLSINGKESDACAEGARRAEEEEKAGREAEGLGELPGRAWVREGGAWAGRDPTRLRLADFATYLC